ncbi:hypothetical protein LINPERPRIM_LOCUS35080 [Linum perenne]
MLGSNSFILLLNTFNILYVMDPKLFLVISGIPHITVKSQMEMLVLGLRTIAGVVLFFPSLMD